MRNTLLASIAFFVLASAFCQDENPLSGVCTHCDTTYHYRKPIGGELERGDAERIICYYEDSIGGKSVQKCSDRMFRDGLQHGREVQYYFNDEVILVNWWGMPYKRPIKPWRKKIFASEMRYYRMRYKGFWTDGQRSGIWKYYNIKGKIVREETYKKGELVKEKNYNR